VFALVKNDSDYDKNAEELRLFYVAISRAKEKLIITYTGNFSKFITREMVSKIMFKGKNKSLFFVLVSDTDLRKPGKTSFEGSGNSIVLNFA